MFLLFAVFHTSVSEAQNDASLIKKANSEFQSGNYNLAINDYRQLLAKDPKNIDFNYKYATCLYHTDDINRATKYYDLIVNMYDPPKESFFYRGKIYQHNYDFQKAIKSFEKYKSLLGKKDVDLGAEIEIIHCKNALNNLKNPGTFKTLKKYEANRNDFFQTYSFTSLIYSFFKVEDIFEKQNSKRKHIPIRASYTKIKYRLFASYGPNSAFGKDIYIQKKNGEAEWSEPIRLGPEVNSDADEDYPFFDEEKGVLYFSSTGHNSIGGYDIFKVDFNLSTNSVSNRENMNFPFSSPNDDLFFVPDLQTNNAYFASNRNGQLGKVEVFLIELSEKPVELTFISGKLTDQIDLLNKSVQINVISELSKERFGPFYSDEDGNYLISVPKAGTYKFQINVSGSTKEFFEIVDIPKIDVNKKLNQEIVYSMNDSKEKLEIITRILSEENLSSKMELRKFKEMAKLEVNAATLVTESKSEKESILSDLGYSEVDSVKALERLLDDLLDIQLDIEKNLKFEEELISTLESNQNELDNKNNVIVNLNKELNLTTDAREKSKLESEKRNLEKEIQTLKKQNYVLVKEIQAVNENKLISRANLKELKSISENLNEKLINSNYVEAEAIISNKKSELKQLLDNRFVDKEKLEIQKATNIAKQKVNLELQIAEQSKQINDLNNQISSSQTKLNTEKNKKEKERIQSEIKQLNQSLSLAKELNAQSQFNLIKIEKEQEAYSENQELLRKIDSRAEDKMSFQDEKKSPKSNQLPDDLINEIVESEIRFSSSMEGKYEQDISKINRISSEAQRNLQLKEREKQYQADLKKKLDSATDESEKEILTERIQLSQSRLSELEANLAQNSNQTGIVNETSNNGTSNSNTNEVAKNGSSNQTGSVNETSNNGTSNSNTNEVTKNESSNQNGSVNETSNNGTNNSNTNEVAKNENSNQTGNVNETSNNGTSNSNTNEVAKNENSNQTGSVNETSNNGTSNSNTNADMKNENSNQTGSVNETSNNGTNNSNTNEVAKNDNSNQTGSVNETSNNGTNNSNTNEVAKNENSNQTGSVNETSKNGTNNSNTNEVAKNDNSNQTGSVNETSNNGTNNSNTNEVAKNENSNQTGSVNETSNNGTSNTNTNEVAKNENSNQTGNVNETSNNGTSNSNTNEVAKNENSNQSGSVNETSNNGTSNTNTNEVAKNENSNQSGSLNETSNNGTSNSNTNEVAKNENSNQTGSVNETSNNGTSNSNTNEVATNENSNESAISSEDSKQSLIYNFNAANIERQIAVKKEELANTNSEKDKKRIQYEISQLKIESELNSQRSVGNEKRSQFNKEFPDLKILSNNDLLAELNELKMKQISIQNKISETTNEQEKRLLYEEKNQLASIRSDIERKVNDSNQKSEFKVKMPNQSDNLSDSEIEFLRQNENYQKYIQERKIYNDLSNELELAKVENRNLKEKINKNIVKSESNELSDELIDLGNQLNKNEQRLKMLENQLSNQFDILNSIDKSNQFEWLLANRIKPIEQLVTNDDSQIPQTAFAIGRNPTALIDKPLPVNLNSPSGLIYRVQVGAYRKPIPNEAFRDFSPVSGEILANGLTCYMAGYFNNARNAINARKQIRALGYVDAFIVAYCDGKRISFAKGRELENSGQCKALTENELILALNQDNGSNNINNGNSNQVESYNGNVQDYLKDPNAKKAELGENNQQLFFTVQVGVYNKPVPNNQLNQFDDLVTFKSEKGQIRYSSGMFQNVNDAKNHRGQVVAKGIPDAYVVAYYRGKRITIAEANNFIARNGTDILKKSDSSVNTTIVNAPSSKVSFVDVNIELPEVRIPILSDSLIQYSMTCNVEEVIPKLEKLNRIGIFTYQSEKGKIVSPKMKLSEITNVHFDYLRDFDTEIQPIDSTKIVVLDLTNHLSSGSFSDWLLRSELNYRFESTNELKKLNIYLDNDFQRNFVVGKAEELNISILNE